MSGSGRSLLPAALCWAACLAGCAGGPQGLKERMRKLETSLQGLTRAAAAELERPSRLAAGTRTLVGMVPLEEAGDALRQGGELVGRELRRREGIGEALGLLEEELAGAGELTGPGSRARQLLHLELARGRTLWPDLRALLAREFSLRSTLDPRRSGAPGREEQGLLPRRYSPGPALIDPLPLW